MQTQPSGGLLGAFSQAAPPQGGLLDAFSQVAPQGAPQGGGGSRDLEMAKQLAANPTPEMGQQIVAQMRAAGMPEADQIEKFLAHVGGDPAAIKQAAMQVIQSLSGQ